MGERPLRALRMLMRVAQISILAANPAREPVNCSWRDAGWSLMLIITVCRPKVVSCEPILEGSIA
jgi:hypothetical protein